MRFGDGLRSEREQRGIALDDIAVATRVSLRNLSALEADRFDELPGGIFNRGIVRSYARYIGLDEDETMSAFTDAMRTNGVHPEVENENWAQFAENVKKGRKPRVSYRGIRWAGVAAMLLFVLLLALGIFAFLVRRGTIQLPPKVASRLHLHPTEQPAASPTVPPSSSVE